MKIRNILLVLACLALAPCSACKKSGSTETGSVPTAGKTRKKLSAPALAKAHHPTMPAVISGGVPFHGAKPNIVFILTDDLDSPLMAYLPRVQNLLKDQGVDFANYFVNIAECSPSRATTLRGEYAHNTKIFGNNFPQGGFQKFYERKEEASTVATWLRDAGYRTGLIGKYLNGYPEGAKNNYIPAGWDEWYGLTGGDIYRQFSYTLNENGTLAAYGSKPENYETDVLADLAVNFILRVNQTRKPLFLYLAPVTPHKPATPAPRHANLFPGAETPRTPSFNETDLSDKPSYIRNRPRPTSDQMTRLEPMYRKRLQSLQAVDEMVVKVMNALKEAGQLENTYVIFTSDNGFRMGQHGLFWGKETPYEEDIHVPLIIRGPGVPAGQVIPEFSGNVDLASTFAELAGAKAPSFVEGRSLIPLWKNSDSVKQWRHTYLIEHGDPARSASEPQRIDKGIPVYQGLRTQGYLFVQYADGEHELYDLQKDPYELDNLAAKAKPEVLNEMEVRLKQLRECKGAACRALESKPMPKLRY